METVLQLKQIWRALITWFFEISWFLKNELNYLIFYSLFWPMHFVSFTYLINFFFVLLPLYLSFLFLGLLIHFFRHCKLEKFKIRAILKMIVRDHSFMILAKNLAKSWNSLPHIQNHPILVCLKKALAK